MDGYQRRTNDKKDKIMATARSLFFKKGIQTVSIAEIAGLAGVSQVSIYNYFGSKDALARTVFRDYLEEALGVVEKAIFENKEIPFREKLNMLFKQGESAADKIEDAALRSVLWDDPKVQALYREFNEEKQTPFLRRFIALGKAEGVIEAWLDDDAALAYYQAIMDLCAKPDFLKKGKNHIASVSHLFYYGLLGK
jgi:AcrR family transcriptional regulator